jgi:hypothetical protein
MGDSPHNDERERHDVALNKGKIINFRKLPNPTT